MYTKSGRVNVETETKHEGTSHGLAPLTAPLQAFGGPPVDELSGILLAHIPPPFILSPSQSHR